jgi:phosphoglycolate phosphatase
MPAATIVFDLDGTLVDSVPDLAAALNRLFAARGLAPLTEAEVTPMVGDGVPKLVERAFAARGLQADAAALAAYSEDYAAHASEHTRAFPGVAATLPLLIASGWRLAVCTNKPLAPTKALLTALGLAGYFAVIGAGDSFPVRKPDPAHLAATLAAANASPDRALMVGDHRNDLAAAAGLGVPAIFAAWGYGRREWAAEAAAVAENFGALPALAARLLDRR